MSLLDDVSIVVTPNGYKASTLYGVIPVPTEGAEEITNGDFSSGSTGWTFTNGSITDKYNASSTAYQSGIKITPFNKTGTYKVSFDLVVTSGSCKFDAGGGNDQIYTTSGTKEILVINTSKFEFNAFNLGWVGTLDNVSVKEWTGADMDVTRATAATRVDEDGLVNYAEVVSDTELITNGDFATDSDWTKGTGWTISGGTANCDGTQSGNTDLTQNLTTDTGKQYKITYTVSNYSAGSIFIRLNSGNITSTKSSNGTFTEVLSGAGGNSLKLRANLDFIGSIDNVSVKEVTRDNVPRIDYTGGGCPHILAEGQRTNLVTYSEDFSNAFWVKNNVTVTPNTTISPDGELTADKVLNSTGNNHLNHSFVVTNAINYTYSIYIKRIDEDVYKLNIFNSGYTENLKVLFNIVTETITVVDGVTGTSYIGSNLESLSNDWFRIDVTFNSFDTTLHIRNYIGESTGTNGASIYYWGAQFEIGSYATSLIPTSGSTVTRNQDIFSRDGIGSLINSEEGTIFVEMAALANDSTNRYISINDGSSTNRIIFKFGTSSNNISALGLGTATSFNMSYSSATITNMNKIALKYKVNDCALWVNGAEVATDTTFTAYTANTLNQINFSNNAGSGQFLDAKVKQLQVYKTALTDTQLAALTS